MTKTLDIDPAWQSLMQQHGLARLDDFFALSDGERLDKPGLEAWRERWRIRLERPGAPPRTLYLKRFVRPPLKRQWERWRQGHWRRSTAGVEHHNARDLARAGIAAAAAIACGQEMCGILERRSFILLDQVCGESLEKWLPPHVPPLDQETDPAHRRERLERLAAFIARFNAAGFVHRDLYLSHVFVTAADASKDEQTYALIDLQRVFRPRWRKRRWVVKDLAALHYSTPADRVGRLERLRFLCHYVRRCDRFGTARHLARCIAARAARMGRRRQLRAAPASAR
jgi:hypothetical protein